MRERWTDDARWVMDEAGQAAAARGDLLVSTGHLLLALLDAPEERLPATLRTLGVPLHELRAELLAALAPVVQPNRKAPSAVGWEPAVRRVEEFALREALGLGSAYIHSGHLLLALLREPKHLAGALLLGHGVDHEVAAKAVREMFRTERVQGRNQEADQARVLHRLDELGRELRRLRRHLEPQQEIGPSRPPTRGEQVAYLVSSDGDGAVLAVTRAIQGQVETLARRLDSKQEAVKAVLADVAESGPDAVACLVDGSLLTVEQLKVEAGQ